MEMKKNQKIILRFGIREIMGVILMGIALFWSAGRIDWWSAWALIGLMFAWSIATAIVILISLEAAAIILLIGAQVIAEYERIGTKQTSPHGLQT